MLVASFTALQPPPGASHHRSRSVVVASEGARNLRKIKAEARANRVDDLLEQSAAGVLDVGQSRELAALLSVGDSYSPSDFSAAHVHFKAQQNEVFVQLALHCSAADETPAGNVFYLEGSDGGSTSALVAADFDVDQLFVANMFHETCEQLRTAWKLQHVEEGRAEEVLRGPFRAQPFVAIYLDGCGGSTGPLISMIEAVFDQCRHDINPARLALGFTLTRAEPSGRLLANREQDITRALVAACRAQGYGVTHVSDAPERFGVSADVDKQEGGTLTTWLVCERVR